MVKAKDMVRFNVLLQAAQETCVFIPSTDLVPSEWAEPFWTLFSDSAPFTWGDNNRTLVTLERFVARVYDAVDEDVDIPAKYRPAYKEWLSLLDDMCARGLAGLYIDLES